jgi:hypothetical protein
MPVSLMKRNQQTVKKARRIKTAPLIAQRKAAERKAAEIVNREAKPFNTAIADKMQFDIR